LSSTILKPTGKCFDDVNDLIINIKMNEGKKFDYRLMRIVHALCQFNHSGHKFAHAWVKYKNENYEIKIHGDERVMTCFHESLYEREFQILQRSEYTLEKARKISAKAGYSTGPWEHKYKKYCRDFQNPV
jgi:hypothetical protein